MAFRRDSDRHRTWKLWVDRHRGELTAAGIPAAVYSDGLRWGRFLENGGLDWGTGWRVEMLTPAQAAILRGFVVREYARPDLACCLRALAAVIGRDAPAA